ncbi:MAG: type II toxin-antitoxin system RelE/ParE family toxin [Alphaproteobacteria bacterium]
MPIKSFAHKGAEDVFYAGRSRRIGVQYSRRMKIALDALDAATCAADLRGSYGFHSLSGRLSGWYAMSISANWRLIFRFTNGDAGDVIDVNFVDYH